MADNNYSERDIDNIMAILDGFGDSEIGRLKLKITDEPGEGRYSYIYHHGRCDIGSPYARGECFDAPEGDCDRE